MLTINDFVPGVRIKAVELKVGGCLGETFVGTIAKHHDLEVQEYPDPEEDNLRIELDEGIRHPYGYNQRHWMIKPKRLLRAFEVELFTSRIG